VGYSLAELLVTRGDFFRLADAFYPKKFKALSQKQIDIVQAVRH